MSWKLTGSCVVTLLFDIRQGEIEFEGKTGLSKSEFSWAP